MKEIATLILSYLSFDEYLDFLILFPRVDHRIRNKDIRSNARLFYKKVCDMGHLSFLSRISDVLPYETISLNCIMRLSSKNKQDMVLYLLNKCPEASEFALQGASLGGHLKLVTQIIEKYHPNNLNPSLATACLYHRYSVCEYLVIKGADKCSVCSFLYHRSLKNLIS